MKASWGTLIKLVFVLLLPKPVGLISPEPLMVSNSRVITQYNCDDVFAQLTANEDWLEQLLNPTLATSDEIVERLDLYSKVYDCIDNNTESLPNELLIIRKLTEYFLVFAGGLNTPTNETALVLIDFKRCRDPAIVQIRDEAGIPAPEGYVFVRFYSSRDAMPDIVKQAFENKESQELRF